MLWTLINKTFSSKISLGKVRLKNKNSLKARIYSTSEAKLLALGYLNINCTFVYVNQKRVFKSKLFSNKCVDKHDLRTESTKFTVSKQASIKAAPLSLASIWNALTTEVENVEELHFIMVKLHQSVRNSVEKIEKKHSVLMLEEESTVKQI